MSTADWPRSTSTAIFFAGCNFHCPYCYSKDILSFNEIHLKEIQEIKNQIFSYRAETIVFCGAEPTLQRTPLLEIARTAKKKGIKVALETNCSKPEVIQELLEEELIDFLGIDIKAPLSPTEFQKITKAETFFIKVTEIIGNIKKTLDIIKDKKIEIEIRTTIIPSLLFRYEDLKEIAKIIKELPFPWVLQGFQNKNNHLESRFNSINPPTKEFMENLRSKILLKYPNLNVIIR